MKNTKTLKKQIIKLIQNPLYKEARQTNAKQRNYKQQKLYSEFDYKMSELANKFDKLKN